MRYARRTDANHSQIRDGLRALGWPVMDLSKAGVGVPDLMANIGFGLVHFLELKRPDIPKSAQALTADQEEWHQMAHSVTSKVTTLEEAIKALEWAMERAK